MVNLRPTPRDDVSFGLKNRIHTGYQSWIPPGLHRVHGLGVKYLA